MSEWTWPTRDPYVTSAWSPLRLHPVRHVLIAHTGTDFRARTGADLLAVHAGTVVRSTYDAKTAGHYIRIDVGDGVWVGYSHASQRLVRVGDRVTAGQVIAPAGATGSATAAHLHFEVSVGGTKVDPVPYLASRTGLTLARTTGAILTGAVPAVQHITLPDPLEEDDMRPIRACRIPGTAGVYFDYGTERVGASQADLARFDLTITDLPITDHFWSLHRSGAPREVFRHIGTAAAYDVQDGALDHVDDQSEWRLLWKPVYTDLPDGHQVWDLPVSDPAPKV